MSWEPTMELRFVARETEISLMTVSKIKVLQQKWIKDEMVSGKGPDSLVQVEEWRDVPLDVTA